MNTYKITATTVTGNTVTENVIETTEAKARKAFREIYRHDKDYTITDIEIISENTCATKQQERDAIEQIKAILETLGPQSYVATALDGCLEIAESNIEYDFGESMKENAENAKQKLAEAERKIADLEKALDDSEAQRDRLHEQIDAITRRVLAPDDLTDCQHLIDNKRFDIDTDLKKAAADIVKFADNPSGPDFQQAVKDHRRLNGEQAYYYNLAARLEAVQQASVTE